MPRLSRTSWPPPDASLLGDPQRPRDAWPDDGLPPSADAAADPLIPPVRSGPVVAVGDQELTDHVACWAEDVARRTDRPLRLVVRIVPQPLGGTPEPRVTIAIVRSYLDRLADRIAVRSGDVDVETEIRAGRWADVVADEAAAASVVVLPPTARPSRLAHVVRAGPEVRPYRPATTAAAQRLTGADLGPGAPRTR
jgi:hypothetical protein